MKEAIKLSKIGLGLKLIFIGIILRIFCAFAVLIPYGAILTLVAIYAEAVLMLIGLWIAGKREKGYRISLLVYIMVYLYGRAEFVLEKVFLNDVAEFIYIAGEMLLEVLLVFLICHTTEKLLREKEEKGIAIQGRVVYIFYFVRAINTIIYGVCSWFFTVPAFLEAIMVPLALCYMVFQIIYIVFLGRSYAFFERKAEELEQEQKALAETYNLNDEEETN